LSLAVVSSFHTGHFSDLYAFFLYSGYQDHVIFLTKEQVQMPAELVEVEELLEESEDGVPTLEDHLVPPDPKDSAGLAEAILHVEEE